MLDTYLQRTQLLLKDPGFDVFNEGDLTTYINMARGQIAGQAECIRVYATLAVTAPTQQYAFSAINLGSAPGVLGVLNVRQITYSVASGQKPLHSRPFAWFNQYVLSKPVPKSGPPSVWSQFGQGASGNIFINLPDNNYMLSLDTACYPDNLTVDSDPEALPYQWTDSVPFFAAYYASLTVGNKEKADQMYDEFSKFMGRARQQATPGVLPGSFAQAPDPFIANRLGLQQQKGQQ